ncbi:MAG: SAM-dependent chlorinase/fluorinase [Acidimicrobiia bacterium]|jgi:S-adenosylmethionine hydrolase|nr:MAG: SAM-dependent chlorinase/fluorinase [Acidimicrobiia bacterium]
MRPISFLSDFGLEDEFVGVVHGVLTMLAPGSRIIDVTHAVGRGDVRSGALSLVRSIPYLPEGICLAVVDPGVGTDRRGVAVETEWGVFVGPDNGLLSPAVAHVGGATRAVSLENPEARLPFASSTFHGRDVFAPAAALLAAGEAELSELGPEIPVDGLLPMILPLPEVEASTIKARAWWIDRFGNVQVNVGPDDLMGLGLMPGSTVTIRIGPNRHDVPWVSAYGDVPSGQLGLLIDSAGLVSLAVNDDSAAERLTLSIDREVVFTAEGA